MGMVRFHPDPPTHAGDGGRLNLLLSASGWREEPWVESLPRLLEPLGVRAIRAESGREATDVIRRFPVHIALVDLAVPLLPSTSDEPAGEEGGRRILDLLSRLDQPPPTVIVKRRRTRREDARDLASALQAGAFAVLEAPVHIETALEVMRRVLCRHYADRWPASRKGTEDAGSAHPARRAVTRFAFRIERRGTRHRPGDEPGADPPPGAPESEH